MQFYQTVYIVGFDVHEGVDAIVGLGVAGEDIFHLVAVPEQPVDSALKHGVAHDVLPHGPVAGIEDADALSQPSVEPVGPDIQHF